MVLNWRRKFYVVNKKTDGVGKKSKVERKSF